jgi:hypothetical protein
VPVFVKTASGKRRMIKASRNENQVFEIESKTLITQAPSDTQWLSFHNISFDEER